MATPPASTNTQIHRIDSPANRLLRADMWAPGEDAGQHSFATLSYFDGMVRRLGAAAGERVLVVGSGTGGPAIYMAERSGCDMTGVEVNAVGVEVAKGLLEGSGLGDRVRLVECDAMSMPFADASFDVVISMNVTTTPSAGAQSASRR